MRRMNVLRYQRPDGSVPVTEWLAALRDAQIKARMLMRIKRVEAGLFGDCQPVGDGVLELREHVGAGHRLYLGRHGAQLVILLCGGDKRSQTTDIAAAKTYWSDWKRRQP